MKFFKNLGPLGWFILVCIICIPVYFVHNYFSKKGVIKDLVENTKGPNIAVDDDADLVLAYNTFPGMQGILEMNDGMDVNTNSELYKKYGIKLQIKQMDAVNDTRMGLLSGKLDIIYCTTDVLPIEMSTGSSLLENKVKQILKINESIGADALVVNKYINRVSDLKGRKVAYAKGTASHTLLINLLETANLTIKDIDTYEVSDGVEAANAFRNNQCDAALVWAPDDEDCIEAVKGSKILVTTKTASQIIADGILVRSDVLDKKRDLIVKLCKAWLEGNAKMNNNPSALNKANELFAKGFSFPLEVVQKSSGKIHYCTLGDNKAFFGFDPTYTGMTAEKMYGRMSVKYSDLGMANSPAPWRAVSDGSVIEEIMKDPVFNTSNQKIAEKVTFKPATQSEITKEGVGNKVVSLTFPTNGDDLSDEAKSIIDREIASLAQGFENAKIRVEGNTDNTGNAVYNKELSKRRANAVVQYLIKEYKFDVNKFIVVGNGQSKPICTDNDEECKQRNRRTDFQFIW